MSLQKTEAIVLRRQEVRETSLLLVAFSRDLGKIHGLVKGVRGARAAVPWYLEPLTLQAMVLYERRRSPVCLISACDLLDAFDPIRRDLTRLAYAGFCMDCVEAMTENGDPHPEIFHLLLGSLRALGDGADPRSTARFLEAHLLKASGLLPPPDSLPLSAGGKLSLQQILQTSLAEKKRPPLVRAVEEELRALFHRFLRSAMERELKSRIFLAALGLEGNPMSHSRPRLHEGKLQRESDVIPSKEGILAPRSPFSGGQSRTSFARMTV